MGQLGALCGKGDIFNPYQAQSSVMCSVQVQLFFLPSTVNSNCFPSAHLPNLYLLFNFIYRVLEEECSLG
jgi:hypothetical protein